jgi:hypothetical protein
MKEEKFNPALEEKFNPALIGSVAFALNPLGGSSSRRLSFSRS